MNSTDRHTLTEHLAFLERMTANGWTFDDEIAALRRVLDEDGRQVGCSKIDTATGEIVG